MWNTAPKKGGEVLPSPAAAALLPGTVSLGLGPAEAVGGGSRTALCSLFAQVCTSVLLGILGCQAANSRLSPLSPLGMCPCHVAATCFASLLLPVTSPTGSAPAHARGSTQGCSLSEAALPTSPRVVGLIKVSVFCTGDCVGLSQTGFAPALGAEPVNPTARAFCTGKRPCGGTCHVGG